MMNEEIGVGDLVMIVKPLPCCGYSGSLGNIFKVLGVPFKPFTRCLHCGHIKSSDDEFDLGGGFVSAHRLKKIPPLSEDESINESKELEMTR